MSSDDNTFALGCCNGKIIRIFLLCILYALCILCTLDTHLFVYPSLSRCLFMESAQALLIIAAVLQCVVGDFLISNRRVSISFASLFVAAWVCYILFYNMCIVSGEEYSRSYLCISLLSMLSVTYFLRRKILREKDLYDGLLIILFIHLLYVYGQMSGLIPSGSLYFDITGANENPTVTALYLVCCMPLLIMRIRCRKSNSLCYILLLLVLVALFALRCRTAIIGMLVEFVVLYIMHIKKNNIERRTIYVKGWKTVLLLIVLVPLLSFLYVIKRDSSDSRVLIWKTSALMIMEHPMGYGYGMYERNYNLRQAEYFRQDGGTPLERRTASFTTVPYNDYLEHGVNGGIAGMLFLLCFYLLIIKSTYEQENFCSLAVFVAVLVMSLVNFFVSSIQPWWLVLCIASVAFSQCETKTLRPYFSILVAPLASVFIAISFVQIIGRVYSQMKIEKYHVDILANKPVPAFKLEKLRDYVSTSEAYWTFCAYNCILQENYQDAIVYLHNAHKYTSSPQVLEMIYYVYKQLHEEEKGIEYIRKLDYMQPSLLRPKVVLMSYYDRYGNKKKALEYAEEIEKTPCRVYSEESLEIKRKAMFFIKENERK